MMLRSNRAAGDSHGRQLKRSLRFAFTQKRFALGQVSYCEAGKIPAKKTEKWAVFPETIR
jgi:hypothetical protein